MGDNSELDLFGECLIEDGNSTTTEELLRCVSKSFLKHAGNQNFSRNVLLGT